MWAGQGSRGRPSNLKNFALPLSGQSCKNFSNLIDYCNSQLELDLYNLGD